MATREIWKKMEIQIKKQMDSREENKEMEAVKRTSGLVHIYCGNGKGKTTASVGAAVRAAGNGKTVLIKRFLKMIVPGKWKL